MATAWQTADWLGRAKLPPGSERLYLIQHEETWSGLATRVHGTWHLPLRKIVTARWLEERLRAEGERAIHIPIGLDFSAFGMDIAPAERPHAHVVSLHHAAPWKGSALALEALRIARERNPTIEATLFGTGPPPARLPVWCRYARNPAQPELRALYNRATLVLSASLSEGWGLVGSEAMMCGAAFVGTDVGGHREFARHEDTALLCPPGDPAALADGVERLVREPAVRSAIAERAHRHIQRFTWARAADALAEVLA
jgi:glycosyltransferase involved in cell wall biosynthesis